MPTYTEMVNTLKTLRKQGIEVLVPLNSNKLAIENEYKRLHQNKPTAEPTEDVATTEESKPRLNLHEQSCKDTPQYNRKIKILEFLPNDSVVLGIGGEYRDIPFRFDKNGNYGISLRREVLVQNVLIFPSKPRECKINIIKYDDGWMALPQCGFGGDVSWMPPKPDTIIVRVNAHLTVDSNLTKIIYVNQHNQKHHCLESAGIVAVQSHFFTQHGYSVQNPITVDLIRLQGKWVVSHAGKNIQWLDQAQYNHSLKLAVGSDCIFQRNVYAINPSKWKIMEIQYKGALAIARLLCIEKGNDANFHDYCYQVLVQLLPWDEYEQIKVRMKSTNKH